MEVPIESCIAAKVYTISPGKRVFWISLAVAAYSVSLPFAYLTIGEPREAAILRVQNMEDSKWVTDIGDTNYEELANISELSHGGLRDTTVAHNYPEQSTSLTNDEYDVSDKDFEQLLASTPPVLPGWFSSWFLTEDQKRLKRIIRSRTEKLHNKLKEASWGGDVILPPWYLPSAWACLALAMTFTFHVLFYLLCIWSVEFRAVATLNPERDKLSLGNLVLVIPPTNRGISEFVPVSRAPITGDIKIDFQRQSYTYMGPERMGSRATEYPNGVFFLASPPISSYLEHYVKSSGFKSVADIERAQELWGSNYLSLPVPSFLLLLKEQLIRPLAIFQLFCALLWLLDEYWTYTLWTLFSVIIFEAVTVFQRTKTLKMLGGMAPKASYIYVFRVKKWIMTSTYDLLPGDLISITKRFKSIAENKSKDIYLKEDEKYHKDSYGSLDIIPCDCLLLTGSAVVNEASLTGESLPQMKESLQFSHEESYKLSSLKLDIYDTHRVNTLFSGTSLVMVSTQDHLKVLDTATGVSSPPDDGVLAYVLRTGFCSSQGYLLQMIEFSQEKVSGDSQETWWALLLLLCFAIIASTYVLREGLRKNEKSTHEILLKCVIIITSVVPRQLPMQMAMAVNMALTALMKTGIYCTEPYRVPLAGKITHCLFDKTGTLTTDQLVPIGVVNLKSGAEVVHNLRQDKLKARDILTQVHDADDETAMVLAACHSLVVVEHEFGKDTEDINNSNHVHTDEALVYFPRRPLLTGDPIEIASVESVKWSWNHESSTATPGRWKYMDKALEILEHRLEKLHIDRTDKSQSEGSNLRSAQAIADLQKKIKNLHEEITKAKKSAMHCKYKSVHVVQRHYFSSNLQRMSVLCRVESNSMSGEGDNWCCLVKGSPEVIKTLLVPDSVPSWYSECYEAMARRGLRVLALAYKKIDSTELKSSSDGTPSMSRERVESELIFCGFISFECKIRADSPLVIKSLKESDHSITMLTGDSLLTSIHVAREVNICGNEGKPICTLITDYTVDSSCAGVINPRWSFTNSEGEEQTIPFDTQNANDRGLGNLSKRFDLVTTEADFLVTLAFLSLSSKLKKIDFSAILATADDDIRQGSLWNEVKYFRVIARMSPQGKRSVISSLQNGFNVGMHVLMCGDGGNDVGALKQADVGVALLGGHANANTSENVELIEEENLQNEINQISSEDKLNAHGLALKDRGMAVNKMREAHMKIWQAEYMKESQKEMQMKLREHTEKGEWMAIFSLMKEQATKSRIDIQRENKRFMAQHGHIWDPDSKIGTFDTSESDLLGMLGIEPSQVFQGDSSSEGEVPNIRPGDASIAAPFTSKIPSVRAVVDLIRQGRCTLLSALMQQQIMMLESIIAAYTLSALSLHNARSSERQMMVSSWLIMTAAVAFSYASPVDKMHPQRPLSSIFHPAVIFSILGQAAIHIACMTLAVHWATDAMGPEMLQEVTDFSRKAKAKQLESQYLCDDDDFMCNVNQLWFTPFMPNLLNTVVFLVETSQMISVFFANYKGRPWMKGMLENHPLFLSVFLCIAGIVMASWEMVPQFNEIVQLAPFPDDNFRYKVVFLITATIIGTFLWDRLCVLLFAPNIFDAMAKEITKTSWKDVMPVLMTLLKVIIGVLILATGNIFLLGMSIYLWWKMNFKK